MDITIHKKFINNKTRVKKTTRILKEWDLFNWNEEFLREYVGILLINRNEIVRV